MGTKIKFVVLVVAFLMLLAVSVAVADESGVSETTQKPEIQLTKGETIDVQATSETSKASLQGFDPLKYTLGPDDAVEIAVMRHPEFSGLYPINQEGKLQYKFVGDIDVTGLTKQQLEQKIKIALSTYVNSPEVNVTVVEYRSKYIYVLGEVGAPGKYYMRSEAIPVREAVFEAGLPTTSAAMRKCRLITPSVGGNPRVREVDLYSILYGGNLKKNITMRPGDVLYVPSTIMAKVIRVINPVASTMGIAGGSVDSAATGKTAAETLRTRNVIP
jgi:polysaccharide export outer membrane protein